MSQADQSCALEFLAKALLRHGVTAHEFARWADAAFVRAAVDLLKAQGTDPSFSRISAITGIHRHAVSAILGGSAGNRPAEASAKEYQRHRLARVLSGWFEDPSFTDAEGRPMALPMDGPAPCFSDLVRAYSGDIYPGIILDELLRVGAVQRASDGRLLAISRRYTTGGVDEAAVSHADVVVADILRTIAHNMEAPPSERFFEDSAIAVNLPPDAVARLARILERRATAFLDDLEGWLASVEPEPEGPGGAAAGIRAGVRVVMVVDPKQADELPDGSG